MYIRNNTEFANINIISPIVKPVVCFGEGSPSRLIFLKLSSIQCKRLFSSKNAMGPRVQIFSTATFRL